MALEALTPIGRSLLSPVITVEEPGKKPAHHDSAATAIWVEDA